jgi:hypothetical protein
MTEFYIYREQQRDGICSTESEVVATLTMLVSVGGGPTAECMFGEPKK